MLLDVAQIGQNVYLNESLSEYLPSKRLELTSVKLMELAKKVCCAARKLSCTELAKRLGLVSQEISDVFYQYCLLL